MSVYYHIDIKSISRSRGRTASGAAAYRAGVLLQDYLGQTHDYCRKRGVTHSEIVLPTSAPVWAQDRQSLWTEADRAEKRKNSTVARECEVALPTELNEEARRRAAKNLAQYIVDTFGVAADVSLHLPDNRKNRNESKNHHAHILFSTRRISIDGYTEKTRELDVKQTSRDAVTKIREKWQEILNNELEREHVTERVDCRSLEAQGISRIPLMHEGPVDGPTHAERRARNETIRAENARRSRAVILQDWADHFGPDLDELAIRRRTEAELEDEIAQIPPPPEQPKILPPRENALQRPAKPKKVLDIPRQEIPAPALELTIGGWAIINGKIKGEILALDDTTATISCDSKKYKAPRKFLAPSTAPEKTPAPKREATKKRDDQDLGR
jgi:hypothetical protein